MTFPDFGIDGPAEQGRCYICGQSVGVDMRRDLCEKCKREELIRIARERKEDEEFAH
jgi:hypothetical protein